MKIISLFHLKYIICPQDNTNSWQCGKKQGGFYVFLCILRTDLPFRKVVHVFGLQIKPYPHKAPITTATIRLHLNTMAGLSQASFCAIQVFHWNIVASQLTSRVRPQSLYLLRFSDASIMALNFEFSSASKAAGLSNSKIYDNEKNRAVISTSTYISLYLPVPRPKLFPMGSVGKESKCLKKSFVRLPC